MPARIRLQRFGKKGKPFYHIVIADGRAPRDGRFIEKIGTYNPITVPAEINIDSDKALTWLQNGALPTDTVRAILSYKGILYRLHLQKGVNKGALTEEQAEAKFQVWMTEKEAKIEAKIKGLEDAKRGDKKSRHEAEAKVKEARAAELAKKYAAELKAEIKEAQEEAQEEAASEAVPEEIVPETVSEVVPEEAKSEPVSEEAISEEPVSDEPVSEKAPQE